MESDPEYMDNLDSLPEKKRKQLLLGCWYVGEDSGMYFDRGWLKKVSHLPMGTRKVRAYDLASSEPTKEAPYPDYTASIRMDQDYDGQYYISCDAIKDATDVDTEVFGRFRKRSGERDRVMLKQAKHDGSEVPLVLPQDSGGAGKDAFLAKVKYFTSSGYKVIKDASISNHSKLAKFEPFATAAEHGLVYIVESSFSPATLEWFYKELEAFTNERSTSRRKDEAVDICASAFNTLNKKRNHKVVVRNQKQSVSITAQSLNEGSEEVWNTNKDLI
jgi:phage terminase large subunit-like protein